MTQLSVYYNYGYLLPHTAALSKLKQHGLDHIIAWVGQNPYCKDNCSEMELYASARDCGLTVDCALVPSGNLPYLSNTRYGRKDAIKTYKQYVLSAADAQVPMLIIDVAPVCDALVAALTEICAFATERGVMICAKDAPDVDMVGLLTAVPDLYYCLDTAALQAMHIDPVSRIEACRDKLMMTLVGDLKPNMDMADVHLLPDATSPRWQALIQALQTNGYQGKLGIFAGYANGCADADSFLQAVEKLAH